MPTSISADAGSPLFLTSSSLSANGITSSARLCRITVPGFTVLAVPHFFQAGQSRTSRASPLLMFIATAPPRDEPTTTCRLVLVELGLGDLDGLGEVLVGQLRVDDLVAVLGQEGRLDAAWDRLPAVEEEDFHRRIWDSFARSPASV